MKTIKEVIYCYDKRVPFPITAAKIKKAGYGVEKYLSSMIRDLQKAEGGNGPMCQDLLRKIHLMAYASKADFN